MLIVLIVLVFAKRGVVFIVLGLYGELVIFHDDIWLLLVLPPLVIILYKFCSS
jgi:hypothetical protein